MPDGPQSRQPWTFQNSKDHAHPISELCIPVTNKYKYSRVFNDDDDDPDDECNAFHFGSEGEKANSDNDGDDEECTRHGTESKSEVGQPRFSLPNRSS